MSADAVARIASLLSKKFLVSVLGLVLVVFFIDVDPAEKLKIVTWIVGIYATANVGQKAVVDTMKK